MELNNNYIPIETIADYCYGDMNDAEETKLDEFLDKYPAWQENIDDFTELMFRKEMGKTELLAFLQIKKEESFNKLFPEQKNNVKELKPKKSNIIHINRYVVMVSAATLLLLVGLSIFMITKYVNIENKLSVAEKKILQKNSIIANQNTLNSNINFEKDSLENQIAEYKEQVNKFKNDSIEKIDDNNIHKNKNSLKYIAQNEELPNIEEEIARGSDYEIDKCIDNKEYTEAIKKIEAKIEDGSIDFCWAYINIAKIALLVLQENPNNVEMIDKAEISLQYAINTEDNCYEKQRQPALLLLAYVQLYKEDKNNALFYLKTLLDENYQQNDIYNKAKQLKEKLISTN